MISPSPPGNSTKFLYGVTSDLPANTKLTNGYDLFHWVMRMSGPPSFWGRALTGNNCITKEEIIFLHNNYCGVALLFNTLTEADLSKKNGVEDGLHAAQAAKRIGAPVNKNIALFAVINDNWSVNHNWMISYAHIILDSGYIPGFIANTDSSKNFNFGRQCSHYVQYMGDIARTSTAYWATEPKISAEPTTWNPFCPSQLTPQNIDIWRAEKTISYGSEISVTTNFIQKHSYDQFIWKQK